MTKQKAPKVAIESRTPLSRWLDARKQVAARQRTARNRAAAAAAKHRMKLRRLVGLQNAVRARLASSEYPTTRKGTIMRAWGWTMAEVAWEAIAGDGPRSETWALSDLEPAEESP